MFETSYFGLQKIIVHNCESKGSIPSFGTSNSPQAAVYYDTARDASPSRQPVAEGLFLDLMSQHCPLEETDLNPDLTLTVWFCLLLL